MLGAVLDVEDNRPAPPATVGARALPSEEELVALIGERMRQARLKKGLTLKDLAEKTGVSVSMLSLVERGRASPSMGTLVAVCSSLGILMGDLFDGHIRPRSDPVARRDEQPLFTTREGVKRRVLQTDEIKRTELVINEYLPGTGSGQEPTRHPGAEYGFVLEGTLQVDVAGTVYELETGDAIGYESTLPHRIWNDSESEVACAVWFNLGF
jgi:transcriptional regulator with XRE-family HTH domain